MGREEFPALQGEEAYRREIGRLGSLWLRMKILGAGRQAQCHTEEVEGHPAGIGSGPKGRGSNFPSTYLPTHQQSPGLVTFQELEGSSPKQRAAKVRASAEAQSVWAQRTPSG